MPKAPPALTPQICAELNDIKRRLRLTAGPTRIADVDLLIDSIGAMSIPATRALQLLAWLASLIEPSVRREPVADESGLPNLPVMPGVASFGLGHSAERWRRLMLGQLLANSHKANDWWNDSPVGLFQHLRSEVQELYESAFPKVEDTMEVDPDEVEREAADVANMAMMVADAIRAIADNRARRERSGQ